MTGHLILPNPTRPRRDAPRGLVLGAIAIFVTLVAAVPAAAKEPPITVRSALMSAAFHCHGTLANTSREPVLLVTGTGFTGEETYGFGKGAFDQLGRPVCDVNFPDAETADIQISVQYLVYAIRREFKASGREIAIFGISQGGLLARMALTYWPDLRTKVADVLSAAGSLHGTTVPPFAGGKFCSAKRPCAPAEWQQEAGSHLLKALDAKSADALGRPLGQRYDPRPTRSFTRRPESTLPRRSPMPPTSSSNASVPEGR